MRRDVRVLAGLIAMLGALSLSDAQRLKQPQPNQPEPGKRSPLQRKAAPDLNENPMLLAAAKMPPAPPQELLRLVPERLGGFKRKNVTAEAHQIGPALYSEVRAVLEGSAGRSAQLVMIDCGGLPPQVGPVLEPMPAGQRKDLGGFVREGFQVDGFPAVLEDGTPKSTRRIQVVVSNRLRVTLESAVATREDLVAAVRAINLRAAAELTTPKPAAAEK